MRLKFLTRLKDFVCVPYVKGNSWNGKDWVLLTDLVFEYKGKVYTIPTGRVTNFGSIPRLFRITLDRMGKSLRSYVAHDETYSKDGVIDVGRKEADDILYKLSLRDGEGKWSAKKIWIGLRIGGWANFKKKNVSKFEVSKRTLTKIAEDNGYKLVSKEDYYYEETEDVTIDRDQLFYD